MIDTIRKGSADHCIVEPIYYLNVRKAGIKGDIQLVFQIPSHPVLTAWIRPIMLLPLDIINNCDDQELEFIITHELNRYRR